ncbi:Methyltransferase domain-containing protein [Evansella caseinilytica]|uniref:Methyltransferase domain-containing protein n=1 Tax=Evansella caseinilytica TaxID=1503961 RepID=A0A1H3Q6G3_9BACI|nr:class I SAM-dependent methyltransferase [Evansella caseinilytica]SDZ08850.1 Methyltransferase domain-containing protein [Evansella caseinilytica]
MLTLKEEDYEKMPGHWVLASVGKTVLRPGGIELTKQMVANLQITANDHVVEFAPGLGITARLALSRTPRSYIGIEQDPEAAKRVSAYLDGVRQTCVVASAENTGLKDESATVVYGEAMLTMHSEKIKNTIVSEAHRILKPGGKYAIHEMNLLPDQISVESKAQIQKELSTVIRVNARPLTITEWQQLLEHNGFAVLKTGTAPMHLLNVRRLINDEGLKGSMKMALNMIRKPKARTRVLRMKSTFKKYEDFLGAVSIIAQKK